MFDRLPLELLTLICDLGAQECNWKLQDYVAFRALCLSGCRSRVPDRLALDVVEYACLNDRLDLIKDLPFDHTLETPWSDLMFQIYRWIISSSDSAALLIHFLDDPRIAVSQTSFRKIIELACEYGRLGIVKSLSQDPRSEDSFCSNVPFQIACRQGHLDVVIFLLQDHRTDPSKQSSFAFRIACEKGHDRVVARLLLDSRVDPEAYEHYSLHVACFRGHLKVVEELLKDARICPSAQNNIAISSAAKSGSADLVRFLLSHDRVNPCDRNNEALRFAAKYGYFEIVKILLQDPRIDPSVSKDAALQEAVTNGHIEIVSFFISEFSFPRFTLFCAFHKAVRYEHLDIVKVLLRAPRASKYIDDECLMDCIYLSKSKEDLDLFEGLMAKYAKRERLQKERESARKRIKV